MKKFWIMIAILFIPFIVSAKNYSYKDLTIKIDEDWMVFTRDNLDNNEQLDSLGVSATDLKKQMNSNNMYIDAITTFDTQNYVEMFLFIKNNDEDSMNLHKYNEKDINKVGKKMYEKYNPEILDIYETNKYKFIHAYYKDKVNGNDIYVTDYYTYINGMGYTIKFQSTVDTNETMKSSMEQMVMSISFKLDKKFDKTPYKNNLLSIIIYAVIGGALGLIVSLRKKKNV